MLRTEGLNCMSCSYCSFHPDFVFHITLDIRNKTPQTQPRARLQFLPAAKQSSHVRVKAIPLGLLSVCTKAESLPVALPEAPKTDINLLLKGVLMVTTLAAFYLA